MNLETELDFPRFGARLCEPQQICEANVGRALFDHHNSELPQVRSAACPKPQRTDMMPRLKDEDGFSPVERLTHYNKTRSKGFAPSSTGGWWGERPREPLLAS